MSVNLPPLDAATPQAIQAMRDAILEQQVPTQPQLAFACLRSKLPPADEWTHHEAWVSDTKVKVTSDGSNWLRHDTGAVV